LGESQPSKVTCGDHCARPITLHGKALPVLKVQSAHVHLPAGFLWRHCLTACESFLKMQLKSKSLLARGIRGFLVVNNGPTLFPCNQGTFLSLAIRKHLKKSIRESLEFSHPLGMVKQQLHNIFLEFISISLQVSTHARLLNERDLEEIKKTLNLQNKIHCLFLSQFDTEYTFRQELR